MSAQTSPQSPRVSLISPSVSVAWQDGTNFTGYYLFQLTLPSGPSGVWASFGAGTTLPGTPVPQFSMFPIIGGTVNQSCGLIYNSDISPPGTQYVAYLYDGTRRLVGGLVNQITHEVVLGPTDKFTVSTPLFTPPTLVAAIPASTSINPAPDSNRSVGSQLINSTLAMLQHATFTPDSVAVTFTLGTSATILLVIWNGVVLTNGVGFNFTPGGTSFTMTTTPQSGDTLEAYWQ